MTSSFRPALFVILVIAAIIAAATAAIAFTSKQRGGAMAVLIDISRSNQGAKGRIKACATASAARAIHDGAVLTIAPVTSAPVYMTTTSIKSKLSLNDRLTSTTQKRIRAKATKRAADRINKVLKGTVREDSSDTIAATAIIGRTLQEQPGPRTLVVCGDAHQVGPDFNMYREDLTPQRDRELIELVAPDLADLRGIDVVFGAAGLDTLSPFTNAREEAIGIWWTKYWRPAVHARTMTYGSSLRLGS